MTGKAPADPPPLDASRSRSPGQGRESIKLAAVTGHGRKEHRNFEDLRTVEEWNDLLKTAADRNDHEKLDKFWSELKERLVLRFGNIHTALARIDGTGDGIMTYAQFSDLLRQLRCPLDLRIARGIFEKASGGERGLHMEKIKALLMQRTIRKLRFVLERRNRNEDRVQLHINTFLRRLTRSDELSRCRVVDRFQRKLTVVFVRDIWDRALRYLGKSRAEDVVIDHSAFMQVVEGAVGICIQSYEVPFLMRIFDEVDAHKHGSANLVSVMTALLLLGVTADRPAKVEMMFEMFDRDYDGCLSYSQIWEMVQCICQQHIIAQGGAGASGDLAFLDALSMQEGLRNYERLRWYLERTGRIDGGVVSLKELAAALVHLGDVLFELIPGARSMRWVIQSESHEVHPPTRAVLSPSPRGGGGQCGDRGQGRPARAWQPGRASRPAHLGAQKAAAGSLSSSPILADEASTGDAGALPGVDGKGRGAFHSEASKFKRSVTQRFQQSLRDFSDQRMADLGMGPRLGQAEDRDAERPAELIDNPSAHSSPIPKASGRVLTRVNSAPCATSAGPGPGGPGGGPVPGPDRDFTAGLALGDLPLIPQKWGSEAVDRFRLFEGAKTAFGTQKWGRPEAEWGIPFKCQLCRCQHVICPTHAES